MAPNLLWWGKLENGTDEIGGLNLATNGSPTFPGPIKFNNGSKGDTTSQGTLIRTGGLVPELYANSGIGGMDFWIQTVDTSGTPCVMWTSQVAPRFLFITNNETLEFYGSGSHSFSASLNLAAGALYHVLLIWDSTGTVFTGSDAGKTVVVKVDGATTISNANTWTPTAWDSSDVFAVTAAHPGTYNGYVSESIIDNLKFWGITSQADVDAIIAGRNTEGFGAVAPVITTVSLANGAMGTPSSETIVATGTAPITFAVTSGTIPEGWVLTEATGEIVKNATHAIEYTFGVTATNSVGNSPEQSYTVTPASNLVISTTSPLASASKLGTYSQALAFTGGNAPVVWTVQVGSSLPAGETISGQNIVATFVTATVNTYTFTLVATDADGTVVTKEFTQAVTQTTIGVITMPEGKVNVSYYGTVAVSGGSSPYKSWILAPGSAVLPAWATLSTGSGPTYNAIVSGIPLTEVVLPGLIFRATDANDVIADSGSVTLTILPGTGQFENESSTGVILMASVRMYVQDAEPTEANPGDEWLNSTNAYKKRNYGDTAWLTITTS